MWLQLTADVLGLPLTRPKQSQGPAYGAALLALQGLGVAEQAASLAQLESDHNFQPTKDSTYRDALGRYRTT